MKKLLLLFKGYSYLLGISSIIGFLVLVVAAYIAAQELDKIKFRPGLATKYLSQETIDKVKKEFLFVRNSEGKGAGYSPQGTNVFLTNYHVIHDGCTKLRCDDFEYRRFGDKDYTHEPSTVHYCSARLDLCAAYPEEEKFRFKAVDRTVPKVGDKVFTVYLESDEKEGLRINRGRIKSVKGNVFTASVVVRKGYSGSPVFDIDGNVIGLVSKAVFSERTKVLGMPAAWFDLNELSIAQTLEGVLLNQVDQTLVSLDELVKFELMSFLLQGREENKGRRNCDKSSGVTRIVEWGEWNEFFSEVCTKTSLSTPFNREVLIACREAQHYDSGLKSDIEQLDRQEKNLINFVFESLESIKNNRYNKEKFCPSYLL